MPAYEVELAPRAQKDLRALPKQLLKRVLTCLDELESTGFIERGGKGSHRNFVHPNVTKPVTISGKPGNDAKRYCYQVRAVRLAIEELKK